MKDAVDSGIKSVTQIPYFEGDFWPNVLEDCAKALDDDEDQDKHGQESTFDADTEDLSCSTTSCSEPLGKVLSALLLYFVKYLLFYISFVCLTISGADKCKNLSHMDTSIKIGRIIP